LKGVYYHFGWETRTWTGFWFVAVTAYIVIQTAAFIMLYKFELPMQEWLRRLRARRIARAKIPATLEPSPNLENVHALPVDSPLWEKRA
jgi:peptidoglycan/LPS O-acetylase OafA/YrhL